MQKKRSTKPKANGWNWIPEQKGNSSCKSLVNETLIYDIRANYPVRNWNRPSPAIIIMQQQCHHRDLSASSYLAGWSWFILNIKAKLQSTIPTVPRLQQVKLTFSKLTHKNNMIKISWQTNIILRSSTVYLLMYSCIAAFEPTLCAPRCLAFGAPRTRLSPNISLVHLIVVTDLILWQM